MNLLEIQHRMLEAVTQPLTAREQMQPRTRDGKSMHEMAAQFIKPNDRLSSFERLEIYNRQYWFRILSGMIEDYPGLRAVLGDRRFDAMSRAYLTACPSRSFTLRNLGERLENWLRAHPKWAGKKQRLTVDMARLEWAHIEAFDGKAEPALRPEDLGAGAGPNLRVKLQPYLQLLDLRYPVDDLLLEVKDDEDTEFASNAFDERRKRNKRVLAVAKLKPADIFLAVHRRDDSVYFRRIEREEFAILEALRRGNTLRGSLDLAFRKSSIPEAERSQDVQEWFHNWAALGWFCKPR